MKLALGVIFVIIFVTSRLPSAVSSVFDLGFETTTFQILQQNQQLRICVESVLHENRYFGCRVSELTGQCQGLILAWVLNQTIEQGYAYAKKVVFQENFHQAPLTLSKDYSIWRFPVVLDTGARIDISMSASNWARSRPGEVFVMFLTNGSSTTWDKREEHWIQVRIMDTHIEIAEVVGGIGKFNYLGWFVSDRLPSPFRSKKRFKMSLLAQPGSLAVFVDDEEVTTFKLTAHTRIMRQLNMNLSPLQDVNSISIHDIKDTGN